MFRKRFFIVNFILFTLFISTFVFADSSEKLNFSAMKSKLIDADINVEIPISLSNYSPENSFTFKTNFFYNSRTQKADFEAYYLDSKDQKHTGEVSKDEYDNDIVTFNVDKIDQSQYKFIISGNVKLENKIILNTEKYNLNNDINNDTSNITEDVEKYKLPSKYIKSNASEIITLAQSIKKSDFALEELVNITNWVHENIVYDLSYANSVENALTVLETRKGVCDEMAILQAAILRSLGYPVKYVVGVANTSLNWGPHAWLEVFIPTQGWIPVDPTYNEVGLVDSSHIVIAKVFDPSECEDKVTTKSNININFGTKETKVKINEQKSFEDLGYDSYVNLRLNTVERLKPNSLFEIKLNLKNTTANPIALTTVVLLNNEFNLIKPKSQKKIVFLDSFSSEDVSFYTILPDTSQPMYYNFRVSTQLGDQDGSIVVDPSEDLFYDAFFVLDPLVYFVNNDLIIDTEVANYTSTNKEINFIFDINKMDINGNVISSDIQNLNEIVNLDTQRIISNNFGNFDSGILKFVVSGDYNYSKVINIFPDLTIEEELIEDTLENTDASIENNKDDNNSNNSNINDLNINNIDSNIWDAIDNTRVNIKPNFNTRMVVFFISIFMIFLILLIVFKNKK